MWGSGTLGVNSAGPFTDGQGVDTNPVLVVGFTTFQLELHATGMHDLEVLLMECDPFTGAQITPSAPNADLGNLVSGITADYLVTFGDTFGSSGVGVVAHTFALRFFVNVSPSTKLTANLRASV